MKKYAKQFVIVLAVAAVLLVLAAVFRFLGSANSLEKNLEADWGVELPSGYEVEYRAAFGEETDGLRFYALLYSDSETLDSFLPWVDSTMATEYADSGAEAASEIMESLGIPGGERPDLDTAGMWYACGEDGSEIFVFHTQQDLRLYLVESLR